VDKEVGKGERKVKGVKGRGMRREWRRKVKRGEDSEGKV